MPVDWTPGITASEHPGLRGYRWADELTRPLIGDSGPGSGVARCALEPERESVRVARSFTTETLRDWGSAELCENVQLVVSELVTNALRAVGQVGRGHSDGDGAGTEVAPGTERGPERPIQLKLVRKGRHVMCLVTDSSEGAPARTDLSDVPGHMADTGWGLHLVHEHCRRWGWTRLRGGGKVVWALFCVPD